MQGISSQHKMAAARALTAPLLPKSSLLETPIEEDEDESSSDDGDDKQPKSTLGGVLATAGVCVLAAAGFAASAAAMVSVQSIVVFVTGGLCCLNAPSIIHRHYEINSAPSIRKSINNLRNMVTELTSAVDFLKKTVDRLENEVDDAKLVEHELKLIADEQGANVENLVESVKENEKILAAIQHNLREVFVAEMARIILRSDKDGDMTIDLEEGHLLALRLKIQLKPHGIELDADRFQQVLEDDNDIGHILKFCAEVLYPESDKKVLTEDQESVASSYDDSSFGSEADDFFPASSAPIRNKPTSSLRKPPSFAGFCHQLSTMSEEELERECSNVKMTKEDKLRMICVSKKYTRGSVAAARGMRTSIVPGAHDQKKRYARASKLVSEANKRSAKARKTMGRSEF